MKLVLSPPTARNDRNLYFFAFWLGIETDAKRDLDRAIILSDSGPDVNELVARQSYCQRAQIWMLWKKQDEGMADIRRAAELGSGWAKTFVAKTNPYAALCNQMLHQMFEQCGVKK